MNKLRAIIKEIDLNRVFWCMVVIVLGIVSLSVILNIITLAFLNS